MDKRTLFQAVTDLDNPDEIEQNGPFKCRRKDAWLGEGYYFWDSFVQLANWWGRESLGNNYVICRSYCVASLPDTYDLYDNPEHIVSFRALSEALSEEYPNKFISVPFVLEMLKAHSDFLKEFKAIRAKAERCWKDVPRLKFNRGNVAYLETIPPIQFCVLDKSYLINGEYQIIYPPKYLVEGVV